MRESKDDGGMGRDKVLIYKRKSGDNMQTVNFHRDLLASGAPPLGCRKLISALCHNVLMKITHRMSASRSEVE